MQTLPQRLVGSLERLGLGRRAQIGIAGVTALLALWGVYRWATTPPWVPAQAGLELVDIAAVTSRLEEEAVAYRLEKGGSEIHVPATDLARVRVLLAEEGFAASGRPGLELFDRPSWGMTDFTQRVNYRRALEGELERTIEEMRGVQAAKVHLALQETSVFRRADQTAEASVVLDLRPGTDASDGMVRGITYLVASSVDRMDSEHVTVLDATGRVLSASYESGSSAAASSRHLEQQLEIERHLEEKARRLVDQVVGPGNADVRVAAVLNFDQIERTVQSVDPEASAILEEERAEIIPGDAAAGAASVQSRSSFESTRSVEQFTQGPGGIERLTVAVLVNDALADDGTGTMVSTPRSSAELGRIEALVRNAVGLDDARGDAITVVSSAFTLLPQLNAPVGGGDAILETVQTFQRPALALLGFLLAFFVALRILRTLRDVPEGERAALAGASGPAGQGIPAGPGGGDARAFAPTGGQAPQVEGSTRERLAARVVGNPQVAARVATSLLRET